MSRISREPKKIDKNKRKIRLITRPDDQEEKLQTPRNTCDPLQIPDQQNEIILHLNMQIQGSQKTPSECVK